jgi:muramoyltetrapeptide carboxypeptidase
MMQRQKPARLKRGATIAVVSPASFAEPFGLGQGLQYLRKKGYRIVLGECTRRLTRQGLVSAPDETRAKELMDAFRDDTVDAILCSRGGYGTMRILPLLDYDVVRDHPKIFMGYSDITTLHVNFHQKAGLVTFHGPGVESVGADEPDSEKGKPDPSKLEKALRLLSSTEPWGEVRNPPEGMVLRTVRPGKASGLTIGGNLSMMTHTLGSPFEVRTEGRILFFEDVHISEYYVEYELTAFELAGKLGAAAGIAVGQFSKFAKREEAQPSLEEVLADHLERVPAPSFTGLCVGHGRWNLPVPIGVRATIDADKPAFTITESALE